MKDNFLKIWKSSMLFAFVLNAVFLALCVIFTSFTYETSADFYNSMRICRDHIYTNATVNYLLASLIGTAQYAFPNINCFVLFEVLASFFAFTSITFVFADKYNKRKAFIFATLLNIMFALHHYTNVDSNRTSALLFAGGFLLILLAIYQKRYTLSCWVGVAEVVLGSFLNFTYLFIALGFAVAFFFGDMIAKKKYRLPFRKLFWYFRPFLLMFLIAAAVTLGLHQFSYSVNHATDEARDYYEYSTLSNEIGALPFPSYSDHIEAFEEAGITTEADYELLKNGYYDGDKSLDIAAMKAVHEMQLKDNPRNFVNISFALFEDNYAEVIQLNRSIIVLAVYLTVSLVFILYHKNRFSFFPLFYVLVGLISGFVLRWLYSGADNLTYGIWVFMIAMLLNSFNFEVLRREKPSSKLRMNNGYMIISCVIVALLAGGNAFIYYYNHITPEEKNSARFLMTELERNPDCYYIMDPVTKAGFIENTENYLHPMWGFREDYLNNLDDFGYFHKESTLRRRNLPENIYEAALNRRKVYVIDNNIVFQKEKYFTQHYAEEGARVTYETVAEPNGYQIYQVRSE